MGLWGTPAHVFIIRLPCFLQIESDFEELYKDKVCMLFEHWPSTFESVLEV
jgi:hypothetical protein